MTGKDEMDKYDYFGGYYDGGIIITYKQLHTSRLQRRKCQFKKK